MTLTDPNTPLLQHLPEPIRERVHPCNAVELPDDREFILYWTHTALRTHDNHTLCAALHLSHALNLPVFVYQGISADYPHASDRHHTFMLESARDLARSYRDEHAIAYALHVERPTHKTPVLHHLLERASLLLTDAMPSHPFHQWIQRLAARNITPVWTVDSCCITPTTQTHHLLSIPTSHTRPPLPLLSFDPLPTPNHPAKLPTNLPFEPVPIADATDGDISQLVAACDIDHSVSPIPHTRGGTVAAHMRWQHFLLFGLPQYASTAADIARATTSRMSTYLRYGCISPFRIIRDLLQAPEDANTNALLDELLIWRELAYHFCTQNPRCDGLRSLPPWARYTLREHSEDPRPITFSWERLSRAQTGDALWDAAHKSLLVHGELHPSMRRSWGKALVRWTSTPSDALQAIQNLNDRYALDGRSPSGRTGALWCLGLFDRPESRARSILGTVRPAPQHNPPSLQHYVQRMKRPARSPAPSIAVIGAGFTGLFIARLLANHNIPTCLFDKGRAPGGRLSTRRHNKRRFDHGTQFFTARDPLFRTYTKSWIDEGHVAPWTPVARTFTPDGHHLSPPQERFVGTPTMSALARHLSSGCNIRTSTRIERIEQQPNGMWTLLDQNDAPHGPFQHVVLTTPSPQADQLLAHYAPALQAKLQSVHMEPCWALMVSFENALDVDFDCASVRDESPLQWIAREGSKPGRRSGHRWILHASGAWSQAHLEDSPEGVERLLLSALFDLLELNAEDHPIAFAKAHRWRYAKASQPLHTPHLYDASLGLGVCGDWCVGPRLEAAFLSAQSMTGALLRSIYTDDMAEVVPQSLQNTPITTAMH